MVHRVFNSAQYFFVKGHHVVNGGQYVNQMVNRVDYSTHMVNTALESTKSHVAAGCFACKNSRKKAILFENDL